MYFSNMLGESGVKSFERSSKGNVFPFVNGSEDKVSVGGVCLQGKSLVVGSASDEIMCKEIREHMQKSDMYNPYVGCKLTYGQVADTESNPLITVLCKGIHFYEGIKTLVKIINIGNDAVLACLVYGACGFEFYDGEIVNMQRCDEHQLTGKSHYYSGEKLKDYLYSVDRESGYDYTYDAVHAVFVNIGMVKGEVNFKFRRIKELSNIFYTQGIEQAREKARAKKEEAKRQAEAHRLNNARMQEEYNKSIIEKERVKEAEKSEKANRTRATKKPETITETGSTGAAAFLAAVANLG